MPAPEELGQHLVPDGSSIGTLRYRRSGKLAGLRVQVRDHLSGASKRYVPQRLRNHLGTVMSWKLFCGRCRTRAGGRFWRAWCSVRQPPVSWQRCYRSLAQGSPDTCGFCAKRGWSRSARRRSGGSTVFVPSHSPKSMSGWAGTGPCGSSGWTPGTPRWPAEDANEGAADDQQHRAGRQRSHPGQPAISRWQRRRAHPGPLRHRHRRPLVGTHGPPTSRPLDRCGRNSADSSAHTSSPADGKAPGGWKPASPRTTGWCGPRTRRTQTTRTSTPSRPH